MYVASVNGILIYDGIDKRDQSSILVKPLPILQDIQDSKDKKDAKNIILTPGMFDCNSKGQIVFDICEKSGDGSKHSIKCFNNKLESIQKYNQPLDGPKKMIKFFGNYIIEVKTEGSSDKIQIYDFDNKISIYNAAYKTIFFVEVEKDAIYMYVEEKNGKNAVYQLTEIEDNLKIESLLKKSWF